jgi:hypothetical protein
VGGFSFVPPPGLAPGRWLQLRRSSSRYWAPSPRRVESALSRSRWRVALPRAASAECEAHPARSVLAKCQKHNTRHQGGKVKGLRLWRLVWQNGRRSKSLKPQPDRGRAARHLSAVLSAWVARSPPPSMPSPSPAPTGRSSSMSRTSRGGTRRRKQQCVPLRLFHRRRTLSRHRARACNCPSSPNRPRLTQSRARRAGRSRAWASST